MVSSTVDCRVARHVFKRPAHQCTHWLKARTLNPIKGSTHQPRAAANTEPAPAIDVVRFLSAGKWSPVESAQRLCLGDRPARDRLSIHVIRHMRSRRS